MRSVRRPDEWFDLLEWSRSDRERRVTSGKSTMVDRGEILLADRASAELSAKARQDLPSAISTLPLEFVDETLSFHPEWIVEKISPRPILFITTDNDRLVPPEESQSLYNHAKEPKKLVTLKGHSHYAVYQDPAFSEVMNETIAWFDKYIPPNYES